MSNQTPNITSLPAAEDAAKVSAEAKRPNILVRAARKIKSTPPKTAIAVAAGVALVSAGAFVGRKTAPLHVEIVSDDFEPESLVVLEHDDTTVA